MRDNNPHDIERKLQNDTFNYTKIDFLNIRNPKIIDALGNMWNNINEKKYYDISDKLDEIKGRLSNDFYSSVDDEYDSKPNFSDIIYRIVNLYNAT
jgi:hypothetical protein|nr:MAG TPA_asm: hypothetical protein [Caudoviricetes sp.]